MASLPKKLEWFVHSIVWIALIFFPLLESGTISINEYLRFCIGILGTLIVFYVNYAYLIKRFLFSKQIWLYLLSNLLLFSIVITVTMFFHNLIPPHIVTLPKHSLSESIFKYIILNVIPYFFLTVLSVALKVTNSWYKIDTERKELEKQRSQAELQNLKNQLNPHFMFNTLNNIYSLIAINGEKAQETVLELSRLLRYMLYDSAQAFVAVEKDIDFAQNYIKLMQIRMPEHVEIKTEIHVKQPDLFIAPLLFISPIENAFKHGVSNSKPSFIQIEIIAAEQKIKCSIRNSLFPKDKQDKSGSGVGLNNLKKRLDLLYPNSYELVCKQTDDTYFFDFIINFPEK